MFGSKTALAHILRGVIGLSALALAILLARGANRNHMAAPLYGIDPPQQQKD